MILGSNVMARSRYYREYIFSREREDILNGAGRMGYSLFLFTSGVKTDMGTILRSETKITILKDYDSRNYIDARPKDHQHNLRTEATISPTS